MCLAKNGVNFLTSQCILYQFCESKQGTNKRVIFLCLLNWLSLCTSARTVKKFINMES